MKFKDWFETMTSTADVATFARPIGDIERRIKPQKKSPIQHIIAYVVDKNKKKQPQVKDE
jgi:hypothetical protein